MHFCKDFFIVRKKSLLLWYLKISTFLPVGLQSVGSENLVKKTSVFLFALAIICIGPVSFPTEKKLCFAKKKIWPTDVNVHKFKISFDIKDSCEQIFLSSKEPIKIGFMLFLRRNLMIFSYRSFGILL